MAPLRRYLRITKYSVLECRIYVDNPALAESWLLNSRAPVLPRVFESVRPLVLPKLREENERSKGKGKKRGVKDVVVEDDFEVSIFLTETNTRHSLLAKQKTFRTKGKEPLKSNSNKITGDTNETAIEVEDAPIFPAIRTEESEENELDLADLPAAPATDEEPAEDEEDSLFIADMPRRTKRTRGAINDDSASESSPKRRKDTEINDPEKGDDDKKKMAMDTSYEGFAIYGRVLCLIVKRRDRKGKGPALNGGGQAMMEDWIASTQMPPPEDDD